MLIIKTATTPEHVIEVLDDTRTLAARRYMLFNKAWLKHANTGSSMLDANVHLQRLGMFLNANNLEGCKGEFNNYVLTRQQLDQDVPEDITALACLVASIDGAAYTDLSDEGITRVAEQLLNTGITQHQVTDTVIRVKKKLTASEE